MEFGNPVRPQRGGAGYWKKRSIFYLQEYEIAQEKIKELTAEKEALEQECAQMKEKVSDLERVAATMSGKLANLQRENGEQQSMLDTLLSGSEALIPEAELFGKLPTGEFERLLEESFGAVNEHLQKMFGEYGAGWPEEESREAYVQEAEGQKYDEESSGENRPAQDGKNS